MQSSHSVENCSVPDMKNICKQTKICCISLQCMDDAEVEAKLAEIPDVDYDRIGERMHVELVYVNCDAEADLANIQHL